MYNVNKKLVIPLALATLLILPVVVLAYPGTIGSENLIGNAYGILSIIETLFGVFAAIMFLYAGFLFLSAQGDPSRVKEAQQAVLWGVIGIVVGLLAAGIVGVITTELGL